MLYLLAGPYAVSAVSVGDLAAIMQIAVYIVAVRGLIAYVITVALAVNVPGDGTGTAACVIVLGNRAGTVAVTVGMQLVTADGGCLRGGIRAGGVRGVGYRNGNAVIVGAGAEIEPLVMNVDEVIDR